MCIIIDANVLASVLNKKTANHLEFKPVLDWVIDGKGKFVVGGTKYLEEAHKYLAFFTELRKVKKTVFIDKKKVDDKQQWAEGQIQHVDFDDPHLVGLMIVSGCKLICSLDARAYPFFQHATFFSPASRRPKIYSRRQNINLLVDANITGECLPITKLTEGQREQLPIL